MYFIVANRAYILKSGIETCIIIPVVEETELGLLVRHAGLFGKVRIVEISLTRQNNRQVDRGMIPKFVC